MKKVILVSLLAIFMLGAKAQQVSQPALDPPYIEVSGTASQEVIPDRIEIEILLHENTSKGKIRLSDMESALAKALKEAEIDASKRMVIESQSSAAQRRSGAYLFKKFILTLHNVQEVEKVCQALAANDLNSYSLGRSYYSKADELKDQLQIQAIKNSLKRAQDVMAAINQTVGKAILVQCNSNLNLSLSGHMSGIISIRRNNYEEIIPLEDIQIRAIEIESKVTVRYALPQ